MNAFPHFTLGSFPSLKDVSWRIEEGREDCAKPHSG